MKEDPEEQAARAAAAANGPPHARWLTVTCDTPMSLIRSMFKETAWEITSALIADGMDDGTVHQEQSEQYQRSIQMAHVMSNGAARTNLVSAHFALLAGTLITDSTSAKPRADEEHWAKLVVGLDLSPDMVADSVLLQSLYSGWSNQFLQERLRLSNALNQSIALTSANFSMQTTDVEVVQRLQRTVMEERCFSALICEVFFNQLLTPLQRARMLYLTSPYVCDLHAILCAISKHYGTSG